MADYPRETLYHDIKKAKVEVEKDMIEINEVTKQFKDKQAYVTALKHVSISVNKG
jgi:ABC-type glutathione transport system ATPase component